MKVQSWFSTCSSSTCATATAAIETLPSSESDTTPTSYSSNSSSNTCSPSLHSNLSLQTLPSVPSLQDLSLDLNLAVSHLSLASLSPRQPSNLPITCLAVHGCLLYAASAHEINVYDRAERSESSPSSSYSSSSHLDAFNGRDCSTGFVKAVAFCDGKVFTAHQDCRIRVWQMTSGKRHKLLTSLPTVKDRLGRFALPKNYVNVRRHKKRLWIEHADAVTGLAVNNGLIYSVSWDKSLKIWRASDLRCLESVKAHEDAVNAVAVSADGTVYTGSADKRIRVWAKPAGEKRHALIATLEKHKSAVNALALNDDGSVLFSGSCDRSILVWEREDSANHMAVTGALRGHGKAILSLFNVSDLLLSGSADRTVRIWRRGQEGGYCCLAVLEGHAKPVKSLAAVRDGDSNGVVTVFSGGLDGEAKVWKVSVSRLRK
ncbi:Myosin heavy chain kinase B [Morus notabilis]|uniref:Myosin heavy chain kinase B n=1 Tax=Morus notabilis TaxID=981085 RepID=W9RCL3_9ROSA|nr:protein JINGUBANG [Morus notabilis]EXB82473.1 Myosin heavy chain kinase B [Morus notabilis]